MTKITKSLYGIFIIGIIISFYQFVGDANNFVGFSNRLFLTANVVFILSLLYLAVTFQKSKNQLSLWLLLLICFPFIILTTYSSIKTTTFNKITTTTPKEFESPLVPYEKYYLEDKTMIIQLVDSLINVGVVYDTSDFALRYFDGKTYKDNIDRSLAIDLPKKIKYEEIKVDTLFYNPNSDEFAGIFIMKEFANIYQNHEVVEDIEYNGYAFIYKKNAKFPIDIFGTKISADSYQDCSFSMREYFLKRLGTKDGKYNLNDVRFWEE